MYLIGLRNFRKKIQKNYDKFYKLWLIYRIMTSSIQLGHKVKETLASYRTSPRQSYEEVIVNLISEVEKNKRKKEELLIEECKEMAKESLKICKEWEPLDKEVDSNWKW